MKTTRLLIGLLALTAITAGLPANTSATGHPTVRVPDITIQDGRTELAAGYAKAFQSLERRPIGIILKPNQGQVPQTLPDVAKLTAFGGALRIELRTGLNYIVSADEILAITDDTRVKP